MEKRPLLLKLAITATAASPLFAVLAIIEHDPEIQRAFMAVAAGLLFIGTGEILNHPLQTEIRYGDQDLPGPLEKYHHRRRNPSGLGNLLFITGMLLLFITLGRFISL